MALIKKKEAGTEAPPKKKGGKGKWIVLAVVVVVAVLGVWNFLNGRNRTAAAVQSVYTTEAAAQRTITKALSGSGTLQPANSYTVTTLVEGEILSAGFEEGDLVEKDQILYVVDSSDTTNSIERAQRSLEQSRLSLESSQRSVNQAQKKYDDTVDQQYVRTTGSGILYSLDVKVGDEVRSGQTVATVRDSAVMTLNVPFPADDAAGFSVGQTAVITLDGSFETLYGTVSEISGTDLVGTGNRITRNVTVEVANPGGLGNTQAATVSIDGVGCSASGTFTYRSESVVTASGSGTVEEIYVPEGSSVSKDQIILTLGGKDMTDAIQNAFDSLQNSQTSYRNSELSLENSQLSLENTREQLDNYTITSPISGTIVDKQYKAGDTISGTSKTLCVIYDLSYLEMTLNVDELDISNVSVGQKVAITADAVEGRTYEGEVTKVSVAGTTSGGITSYPVTIRLEETDGLLPGMNVDAEIIIANAENVLSIPNNAVNRGNLVLVTADSPSAVNAVQNEAPEGYVYIQVETGISGEDYVEITGGLQSGDTVAYIPTSGSSNSFGFMMGGGMPGGGMPGGGMPGGGSDRGSYPGGGPRG